MLKQTQNNISIIGIDVSKDKLDVHCYDNKHKICIQNNKKSIVKLIKDVSKNLVNPLFIMESTGGYEKLAQNLINDANYNVHIAHPLRIHYFAKQKGLFAKTDRLDAAIIAQYGIQENVKPTPAPSKLSVELKELASRRTQLIDLVTKEKCRVKSHQSNEMNRSLKRVIKAIEAEIELLNQKISKKLSQSPEHNKKVELLQTVKGIGEITAHSLVCLLPELGTLSRAKIACLCGLAPKNKDSGIKTGKRHINGGRFNVRKALYMAAVCASTHNPKMREFYQKLKNKGKESKVALTAVMRKLIITINAMLRDEKEWAF